MTKRELSEIQISSGWETHPAWSTESVKSRVMQGKSFGGALKSLVNRKTLSIVCVKSLHEGVIVPTHVWMWHPSLYRSGWVKIGSSWDGWLAYYSRDRRIEREKNEDVWEECKVKKSLERHISFILKTLCTKLCFGEVIFSTQDRIYNERGSA